MNKRCNLRQERQYDSYRSISLFLTVGHQRIFSIQFLLPLSFSLDIEGKVIEDEKSIVCLFIFLLIVGFYDFFVHFEAFLSVVVVIN